MVVVAVVEGVCFYDPEIYAIVSRWESLVSFQILFSSYFDIPKRAK